MIIKLSNDVEKLVPLVPYSHWIYVELNCQLTPVVKLPRAIPVLHAIILMLLVASIAKEPVYGQLLLPLKSDIGEPNGVIPGMYPAGTATENINQFVDVVVRAPRDWTLHVTTFPLFVSRIDADVAGIQPPHVPDKVVELVNKSPPLRVN